MQKTNPHSSSEVFFYTPTLYLHPYRGQSSLHIMGMEVTIHVVNI